MNYVKAKLIFGRRIVNVGYVVTEMKQFMTKLLKR